MASSASGTGGIVLAKANAAANPVQGAATTPPGYSDGGFAIQGGLGHIDPTNRHLLLRWALPVGSPSDLPIVLTYYSDGTGGTELGTNWYAPYHRFVEQAAGNPTLTVNSAGTKQPYTIVGSGPAYVTAPPGTNVLTGSPAAGWTETQPDGAAFSYDGIGILRTIRNNAGTRWTLNWDPGTGFLRGIVNPFGRRTTFLYSVASPFLRGIQDPGGRITSFSVDSNGLLARIVSPELCVTSLVSFHPLPSQGVDNLIAWVDPLGHRTSYVYDSLASTSVRAVVRPLGQRTTYLSYSGYPYNDTVVVNPRGGRTTIMLNSSLVPVGMLDPAGNRTTYVRDTVNRLTRVTDARGNSTTFTYATTGGYSTALTGVSVPGPGGVAATYSYQYDGNDRLSRVTDELGNQSAFVWDSGGNRVAVVDPYGKRTSYSYDAHGRAVGIVDALGHRSTHVWDAQGRLAADVDPLGNRTTYAYTVNSQVASVKDPLGHVSTYVRDEMNRLVAQADPLGNRTSYTYDLNSRLIRTTDPLGHISTAVYDANGRTIATVDPLGHRTSYAYDADGNLVRVQNPIGAIATSVYDLADRLIADVDPLGHRTSYAFDAAWNPKRMTNAAGNVGTVVFNSSNLPAALIDPVANRTSFVYDAAMGRIGVKNALGNIGTVVYDRLLRGVAGIDPLGNRSSLVYDIAGRPIRATDPLGHSTTTVYDATGRIAATVDPLLNRTSVAYDAASRPIRATDARGYSMTAVYDAASRPVAAIDPLGARTSFVYDLASRRVRVTDALGHSYTTVYDAAGRIVASVDPLLHRASFAFDAADRRIASVDPLGHATTIVYDLINRVIRQTEPAGGGVTSYAYDALSRVTRLIDPAGNVTTYGYDKDNRVAVETDPLGKRTTYVYDAVSNLTQKTDRAGRVTQYAFDADRRKVRESWIPLGGGAATYVNTITYDAASRVTGVVDKNSQYGYGYDAANRLTMFKDRGTSGIPVVTFTYGYDQANNRTSLGDGLGGVNSYTYDARNVLTRLSQSGTGVASKLTSMAYDVAGRIMLLKRYSDLAGASKVAVTSYSYDVANRLTRLANLSSTGATISSYGYTLDAAGRLTSELRTWAGGASTDTVTYGYTNNDQVTSVSHTNGSFANESFSYDANGNRNSAGYATGPANQVTSDGTYNYGYDAEGNLISKTSIATGNQTLYKWDYRNRLVEADSKVGATTTGLATYTYDARNNLIKVVEGGVTRDTLYDGRTPLLDFNGSGTVTARYLSDPRAIDQMLARETTGGAVGWYLADRLGTVRDVVNASGSVIDRVDYSAYGTVTGESSSANGDRFKFAGMELDSVTALNYVRARWYDPVSGRFVSQDLLGFGSGDENLYRYVTNEPVNAIDLSGLAQGVRFSPTTQGALNSPAVRNAIQGDISSLDRENALITDTNQKMERGGWVLFDKCTGNYIVSHQGVNVRRISPMSTSFQPSGPRIYSKGKTEYGPLIVGPDLVDDKGAPLPAGCWSVFAIYHIHPKTGFAKPSSPADYQDLAELRPKFGGIRGILITPKGEPYVYGPLKGQKLEGILPASPPPPRVPVKPFQR